MNKLLGIIVIIIIIVGGAYILMRTPGTTEVELENKNEPVNTQENEETSVNGRVIFSVTDAAADMSAVSEINMTVSKAEIHSTTAGWVVASSAPQTYSLLELDAKNESKLLADFNLKADSYDQIRLSVDSISVKTKAGATKEAKLPSGELKINTKVVVKAGETSSVNFDFLAAKSLHTTGNGSYIFAPVVKTESKSNANVNIDANNSVLVVGGNTDDSNTVGMDIDGSVKLDFELKNNVKLNIDSSNKIKLGL